MSLLVVKDLVKEYRSHWTYVKKQGGLKGVSFNVAKGESFALLGANGAGKTTTIKCILGLTRKTSGLINFGSSQIQDRSKLAYLPEQPYFYQHLSVYETLELYAGLYGLSGQDKSNRIENALRSLSISDFQHRRLRTLSKGQLQRVGIAQTLLPDPDLLILDEPFSGLDPVSRVEIKSLFKKLKEQGRTLIICSHVLSEIEELCDRAVVLKNGKTYREIQIHALRAENHESQEYRIVCESKKVYNNSLNESLEPKAIQVISDELCELEFVGTSVAQHALRTLVQQNIPVLEFSKKQQSLEQIFVEINKGA